MKILTYDVFIKRVKAWESSEVYTDQAAVLRGIGLPLKIASSTCTAMRPFGRSRTKMPWIDMDVPTVIVRSMAFPPEDV
jgi:hypothetical protein